MEAVFSDWLEQEFLKWQLNTGGRRQLAEFAEYIGVSKAQISQYINKIRRPSYETVVEIADVLGPKTYDAAGLARPDPRIGMIIEIYDELTEEEKDEIIDAIRIYFDKKGKSIEVEK
jgi:transcriptional regulator with XRE-family HTH domain